MNCRVGASIAECWDVLDGAPTSLVLEFTSLTWLIFRGETVYGAFSSTWKCLMSGVCLVEVLIPP